MALEEFTNEPYDNVDTWDVISVLLVFLGAATMSGFAIIELAGYSLGAEFTTLGSATVISYGALLSLVGYGSAAVTNGVDRDEVGNMSQMETAALAVGVGGVIMFIVAPDIASFFSQSYAHSGFFTGGSVLAALGLASE